MSQVQIPPIARPGVAPGGMAPAMPAMSSAAPLSPPPLYTQPSPSLIDMWRYVISHEDRIKAMESVVRGMASDQTMHSLAQHFAALRQDTIEFANSILERLQIAEQAVIELRAELNAVAPLVEDETEPPPPPKRRVVAKRQLRSAAEAEAETEAVTQLREPPPDGKANEIVKMSTNKIDGRFKK